MALEIEMKISVIIGQRRSLGAFSYNGFQSVVKKQEGIREP